MKQISTIPTHHRHTLSCSKVYAHLCENLDSELDSESCRRIKEHIEGCENCTALLDSLKMTVSFYKRYPCPQLPSRTRKKLFSVIQLEKRKKRHSR